MTLSLGVLNHRCQLVMRTVGIRSAVIQSGVAQSPLCMPAARAGVLAAQAGIHAVPVAYAGVALIA